MKKNEFDVIIVGAGPAGIFASLEIVRKKPSLSVALIDMGHSVSKRKTNDVMSGFGGAGTYSDGKLHYTVTLSHERALHLETKENYEKILYDIKDIFKSFGVHSKLYPLNTSDMRKLIEEAERYDIELVERRVQHVGTDNLKSVIKKMEDHLIKNKINLIFDTQITDVVIKNKKCVGVVGMNGNIFYAKKILLAPGRINTKWLQQLCVKHSLGFVYGMVEVGVRIEFSEAIFRKFAETMYESIFKIRTKTYDDIVRTFCPCPGGMVAVENYQGYVCVNGHSDSKHESKTSNFAFVSEVNLTEPVENSIAYAESIAKLASTIGGGRPILQRLADLKKGRRSTWSRLSKSLVKPSLTDVTPGDISMALPHRIVTNIIEGLEILDYVMPGINAGSTLLYAPEVKFRSSRIDTNKHLETHLQNLFVAGDAAGLSGSITGAAATGILAARGMVQHL